MNRNNPIEAEVEKTLGLLQRRIEIEDDPYFYARLKHRIDNLNRKKLSRFPLSVLLEAKYLRPAAVTVVFLVNIFSGVILFSGGTDGYLNREQYLEVFAEEFSLFENSSELPLFQ